MKNDHDIITKEEMIELTGHHYKTKQCDSLRRSGIFLSDAQTDTRKPLGAIFESNQFTR